MYYVGLLLILQLFSASAIRLCVPDGSQCSLMNKHKTVKAVGVICVPARDRLECLHKLKDGLVDVTVTDNYQLYLGHLMYGAGLSVLAETRFLTQDKNKHRYEGVSVVRRSNVTTIQDLKGAKSCHTGFWRTAGWHIPTAKLRSGGHMVSHCMSNMSVVEQSIYDVARFFSSACIPGAWAPDPSTDAKLKEKYSTMCDLCVNNGEDRCSSEDPYAGYIGALQCLVDGGSVGWSKYSKVKDFFQHKSQDELSKYGLLCPDNRVIDVLSSHDEVTHCAWAGRPWDAWVVRATEKSKKTILKALNKVMKIGSGSGDTADPTQPWTEQTLRATYPSKLVPVRPVVSIQKHLTNMNYYVTMADISCDKDDVIMCVEDNTAFQKCEDLSKAMEASRVRPILACVMPEDSSESCLTYAARKPNVITVVDGADVYYGHKNLGLQAIISEKYGSSNESYYAVAVVRKSSNIQTLKDLKGKKSCHTGIQKTAGWKMPVATLLEEGQLTDGECDFPGEMAKFFTESCVPGAKDPKYDIAGTNPQSLCNLCAGDGGLSNDAFCARNSNERHYGYSGAFRCLVEGGGDVAFVKHTTVPENTGGINTAAWAEYLKESDYRLLCPGGRNSEVGDYQNCHLERVPAHKVIIGPDSTDLIKEEVRIVLLRAPRSVRKETFVMFGPFENKKDLIFKDSTTELVNLPSDVLQKDVQDSYDTKLEELDTCVRLVGDPTTPPPTPPPQPSYWASFFYSLITNIF